MNKWINRALVVLVLAGLCWVGHQDKIDALREQSRYCYMVRHHYWPDFHHTYRQSCIAPRKHS